MVERCGYDDIWEYNGYTNTLKDSEKLIEIERKRFGAETKWRMRSFEQKETIEVKPKTALVKTKFNKDHDYIKPGTVLAWSEIGQKYVKTEPKIKIDKNYFKVQKSNLF